jgi:hypothetical protein
MIAEYAVRRTKPEELFQVARRLEQISFAESLLGFDDLDPDDKSFIPVLLDYIGIHRVRFASGWSTPKKQDEYGRVPAIRGGTTFFGYGIRGKATSQFIDLLDYPVVEPAYAAKRSMLAKEIVVQIWIRKKLGHFAP